MPSHANSPKPWQLTSTGRSHIFLDAPTSFLPFSSPFNAPPPHYFSLPAQKKKLSSLLTFLSSAHASSQRERNHFAALFTYPSTYPPTSPPFPNPGPTQPSPAMSSTSTLRTLDSLDSLPSPGLPSSCSEVAKRLIQSVTPAESDSVRQTFATHLESAFSLLSHRDASAPLRLSEFLLSRDPQTDVEMLTNPRLLQHATTVSIANSEIAVGGSHDGLFDSEITVDFMMIPARVQGVLSFGAIGRRLYGTTASCRQNRQVWTDTMAMGRFVRNEETGESLILAHGFVDENGSDSVSLVHTSFESSTKRTGLRATFNPEDFDDPEKGPVAALKKASYGVHTRFCNWCKQSPHFKCDCVVPYLKPSGPDDLATFALNTRHSLGDWLGSSETTVHCNYVNRYASAPVMTRLEAKQSVATIPLALHEGLLQSRLSLANPARAVMPDLYGAVSPAPELAVTRDAGGVGDDQFRYIARGAGAIEPCRTEATASPPLLDFVLASDGEEDCPVVDASAMPDPSVVVTLPLPSDSLDRELFGVFDVSADVAVEDIGDDEDNNGGGNGDGDGGGSLDEGDRSAVCAPDVMPASSPVSSCDGKGLSPPPATDLILQPNADPAALVMKQLLSQQPELAADITPAAAGILIPPPFDDAGRSATSMQATLPLPASSPIDTVTPSDEYASTAPTSTGSSGYASERSERQQAQEQAKGKGGAAVVPGTEAVGEPKQVAVERAEVRKEKNRAAARVSNQRRKERNLNLRKDLKHFREKLETLRKQEALLREENSRLKNLAGS